VSFAGQKRINNKGGTALASEAVVVFFATFFSIKESRE